MRMKQRRTRAIDIRRKYVTKDAEGVPNVTYGSPYTVIGEIWSASDSLQIQTYGDRVNSIMNVRIKGEYDISVEGNETVYAFDDFEIREGDGVGIYENRTADYKIVSIKPYKPLKMEIQKL